METELEIIEEIRENRDISINMPAKELEEALAVLSKSKAN